MHKQDFWWFSELLIFFLTSERSSYASLLRPRMQGKSLLCSQWKRQLLKFLGQNSPEDSSVVEV